jgi:hypothetical protein
MNLFMLFRDPAHTHPALVAVPGAPHRGGPHHHLTRHQKTPDYTQPICPGSAGSERPDSRRRSHARSRRAKHPTPSEKGALHGLKHGAVAHQTAPVSPRFTETPFGTPSTLGEMEGFQSSTLGHPDMGFVPQTSTEKQQKVAAAQRRFWSFVLPDRVLLEPRQREAFVKLAPAQSTGPQTAPVPLAQPQRQMAAFLPQRPPLAG